MKLLFKELIFKAESVHELSPLSRKHKGWTRDKTHAGIYQ